MRKLLLAVLLVGLVAGAESPKEWDDTTTTMASSPEGTWHLVRITRGGQDDANPGNWDMVFGGNKYSWRIGPNVVVEGNYKIDLNRTPAQLDLMPGNFPANNITNKAIYRIDGDVLLIGLFEPERERPRSFGDANLKLLTLKRVKK